MLDLIVRYFSANFRDIPFHNIKEFCWETDRIIFIFKKKKNIILLYERVIQIYTEKFQIYIKLFLFLKGFQKISKIQESEETLKI